MIMKRHKSIDNDASPDATVVVTGIAAASALGTVAVSGDAQAQTDWVLRQQSPCGYRPTAEIF